MVFAVKALIGAIVAGTGALVPIAVNKAKEKDLIPDSVVKLIEGTETFKGIKERDELSRKNINVSKAIKFLRDKKCQVVQNPNNKSGLFNSLYGCKVKTTNNENKAEFYYFVSGDSVKADKSIALVKKVISVNYKKDTNTSDAYLSLKLDGKEQEVKWSVAVDGIWKYFKDVDLSKKCTIETPKLGKDVLRCELKDDTQKRAIFNYVVSIF